MRLSGNPKLDDNLPCWVDLAANHCEVATHFYSELFGWTAVPQADSAGYSMFLKDGLRVAGCGGKHDGSNPTAWSLYVRVSDADKTVLLSEEAGGTVLLPPMPVLDQGRLAVLADAAGASFCIWEPWEMSGADLTGQSNTWCWSELITRDRRSAAYFYEHVFGWTMSSRHEGRHSITEIEKWGDKFGHVLDMPEDIPPRISSYWLAYFGVTNLPATMLRARALGATVVAPSTDIGIARIAVMDDPQGATFALIQMK